MSSRRLLAGLGLLLALGGCTTYDYVGTGGGYYSGQPRTEYRYQGGGYGYPYYAPGSTLGVYYGRSYPYGYNSWGYPGPYYPGTYYVRPPYPQHPHPPRPRPDGGQQPAPGGNAGGPPPPPRGSDRAPWRDLERIRRGNSGPDRSMMEARQMGPRPGPAQSGPRMSSQPRPAQFQGRPDAGGPRPAMQPRPQQEARPMQQQRPMQRMERPMQSRERNENRRTQEP